MAQRTVVQLIDDIEGTELVAGTVETVTFALDGVAYEIDLTEENAKRLRAAVEPYVVKGRRISGGRAKSTATAPGKMAKDYETAAVKAWAAANKIDVPARGRLPKALIERYMAAGNEDR